MSKNCVLYLVRTSEADLEMLNKSLMLLDQHLLVHTKAEDVILFHDPSFTKEYRDKVYRPMDGRLIFQEITFPKPPPNTPEIFPHPIPEQVAMGNLGFSIGYRNMCWFFSGGMYKQSILDDYTYYLRLDTDSYILSPLNYDIFEMMEAGDYKYGFISEAVQYDHPAVIEGLWSCAKYIEEMVVYFSPECIIKPVCDIPEGRMYYTNFEVGAIDWFKKSAYDYFFANIEADAGIFHKRWGDAPIKYLGVNMFMEDKHKVAVKGFTYQHGAIYNL